MFWIDLFAITYIAHHSAVSAISSFYGLKYNNILV